MAKTVPLDVRTLAWARTEFARYYATAQPEPPERLPRRELALFPFAEGNLMRRHTTVPTREAFVGFLREAVPRHVYYSSAYYRAPAEPTMAAKGWLGADLIFDLDADHLRGAEALDYAGQLALVKTRLLDLVDQFLLPDLGLDAGTMRFAFSGGRGYHVHVRDERFLNLSSPERRELVDYVLGTGVDPTAAVQRRREDVREGRSVGAADAEEDGGPGRRGGLAASLTLAPPETPGWPGRTTRAVLALLERWQGLGPKAAAAEIAQWGIAPDEARIWARRLLGKGKVEKIRSSLSLDVFGEKESARAFLDAVVRHASVEVQAETDAPVTTDIHRLIRLPDSLHGGTGFRVVPLRRDELDAFDPFRDAVVDPGTTTAVTVLEEVRYPFAGGELHRSAGATDELPTAQALFLVLRGQAALRSSPG